MWTHHIWFWSLKQVLNVIPYSTMIIYQNQGNWFNKNTNQNWSARRRFSIVSGNTSLTVTCTRGIKYRLIRQSLMDCCSTQSIFSISFKTLHFIGHSWQTYSITHFKWDKSSLSKCTVSSCFRHQISEWGWTIGMGGGIMM